MAVEEVAASLGIKVEASSTCLAVAGSSRGCSAITRLLNRVTVASSRAVVSAREVAVASRVATEVVAAAALPIKRDSYLDIHLNNEENKLHMTNRDKCHAIIYRILFYRT